MMRLSGRGEGNKWWSMNEEKGKMMMVHAMVWTSYWWWSCREGTQLLPA